MRIAVFGVGAVGGYFGGRLAQSGTDVTFIARGATLKAMRELGLRVTSIKGDFTIYPAQVTDNPAEIGAVDVVLVAVKAWQVTEAARAIQPIVGPETMVVPLQNGVEATNQLQALLGEKPVVGGFCRIISAATGPAQIHHMASEPSIVFGELDNAPSERTRRLQDAFTQAGVKCEIPADFRGALWEKFLFVAGWGGIGAITRAPIGVLRELPETRAMLEQSMQEIFRVAISQGIELSSEVVAETMSRIDRLAPISTTSMQRDIAEGWPSELEAQIGAIVRLAREGGVAVPLNEFIYHAMLPLEKRARRELGWD
jgi:2-dehydropantoate 2-reductase